MYISMCTDVAIARTSLQSPVCRAGQQNLRAWLAVLAFPAAGGSHSVVQSRPFDLFGFLFWQPFLVEVPKGQKVLSFWSIFSRGPKRLTFYSQVLRASVLRFINTPGSSTTSSESQTRRTRMRCPPSGGSRSERENRTWSVHGVSFARAFLRPSMQCKFA